MNKYVASGLRIALAVGAVVGAYKYGASVGTKVGESKGYEAGVTDVFESMVQCTSTDAARSLESFVGCTGDLVLNKILARELMEVVK